MGFIDTMIEQGEPGSRRRAYYHFLALLAGVPLIYILSVAPAVVVVNKFPKIRDPVRSVYAPVIWLHNHKFMTRQMDLYLGFWKRAAQKI